MQRSFSAILLTIATAFCFSTARAQHPSLPSPVIPEGFGVNIHFTDPQPGEMKMIAESGVRWVRMDVAWDATEREKGVYDFSAYDRLVKTLDEYGLKALFILVYGSPLYDGGLAPHSDEGRRAFARWAVAAAKHFAGKGYLWELWNEPNLSLFWKPKKNAKNHILLAQEVGRAFQMEVPEEPLLGPASSEIPLGFLMKIFREGLLQFWSGVSVHPYRGFIIPETAGIDYQRLDRRIANFSPEGKRIPIISSEWGYSTTQWGIDEKKQAKFLARMWLFNLSQGIPLSIWYDWRDDGTDPKEMEHHFGLVRHTYLKGKDPPFEIKPAYLAAKTLTTALRGFSFHRRIRTRHPRSYLLEFKKNEELRWVYWNTSGRMDCEEVNISGEEFELIDLLGESRKLKNEQRGKMRLTFRDSPQYLILKK